MGRAKDHVNLGKWGREEFERMLRTASAIGRHIGADTVHLGCVTRRFLRKIHPDRRKRRGRGLCDRPGSYGLLHLYRLRRGREALRFFRGLLRALEKGAVQARHGLVRDEKALFYGLAIHGRVRDVTREVGGERVTGDEDAEQEGRRIGFSAWDTGKGEKDRLYTFRPCRRRGSWPAADR